VGVLLGKGRGARLPQWGSTLSKRNRRRKGRAMARRCVLFLLQLSQSLGNDTDNVGLSRDTSPYLVAHTRGVGHNECGMSRALSGEGRGRKESQVGSGIVVMPVIHRKSLGICIRMVARV